MNIVAVTDVDGRKIAINLDHVVWFKVEVSGWLYVYFNEPKNTIRLDAKYYETLVKMFVRLDADDI